MTPGEARFVFICDYCFLNVAAALCRFASSLAAPGTAAAADWQQQQQSDDTR
jgi:hypothetical protein